MGSEPQQARLPLNRLTPDEVRQTTFRQSQLAWRGYSEDEVDAFKTMVADHMVTFEKERTALRSEIERLRNFYRKHGTDVDVVKPRSARQGPGGPHMVGRISDQAETHLAQAREHADLITEGAEQRAEEVLHHAMVRSSISVQDALRARWETGNAVGVGELRSALTWLRAFSYALQVELKVIDDVLVREGQRLEATTIEPPHR
ncbi:MAG TPA: DivIVA domain-containing protein [Actinoplanes sp.]|jgi:DivIVA domain-containing protein